MDSNNWTPPLTGMKRKSPLTDPLLSMDSEDWRTQLQPESRQRIVNKIMETLKRNLPFSGQDGLKELKRIAVRFEEKIYTASTSQADYLRKISLKMLTMETKSQNSIVNSLTSSFVGNSELLSESAPSDSTTETGQVYVDGWQEEVYQKIKSMNVMYLPEITELYQKLAGALQQHESHPQQPKTDQIEKLRLFKTMLECIIQFLQLPKSSITLMHKEKLSSHEKQIQGILNSNRRTNLGPPMQQGQFPSTYMQPMQQLQQTQSQVTQLQPHEDRMSSPLHSMNVQGSVASMQQNNTTSLQQGSMSSLSGVATPQQNMMNSLQPGFNLVSGQGSAMGSIQQVFVERLKQNPAGAPQQPNINTLSPQSGTNLLQPNVNHLQSNSKMLQQQHITQQQQEQQFMPLELIKEKFQQHRMLELLLQQQILQEMKQQQLSVQLQGNQPQLHQRADINDLKMRQVKPGAFQQHHVARQHSLYHQQLKSEVPFPLSSPQMLQTASPQIPQHSSPPLGQQNLLSSLIKARTPLQSANSSFIFPSPSTPLAPSSVPGDQKKHNSSVSSLPNAENAANRQTIGGENNRKKGSSSPLSATVSALLLLTLMCFWGCFLYEEFGKSDGRNLAMDVGGGVSIVMFHGDLPYSSKGILRKLQTLVEEHIIGLGGFGTVYKLAMDDGDVFALKITMNLNERFAWSLERELEILGSIKCHYLVYLHEYRNSSTSVLLVYDYLPNGSLDEALRDWDAPRNMIMGSAKGLTYLHHDYSPWIILRDIKSINILLDGNLEARLSDFGLTKFVGE